MVMEARAEEMKEFKKHKVYTKVPLSQCWARTGRKPIGVRWVDIKGIVRILGTGPGS